MFESYFRIKLAYFEIMNIQTLYCHRCDKHYNVRVQDLELMQRYHNTFDDYTKGYYGACFFKNLGRIKRSLLTRKQMSEETIAWLQENDYTPEDLNFAGAYGNTALMKAARVGELSVVEELLDAGADITCKNIDGNTALWLGCFSENPLIVSKLLEAGIEVDTKNEGGVTSLMYAASSGKEEMVSLLVEAGADVSIENDDGFSALDLAVTPTILRVLKKARK